MDSHVNDERTTNDRGCVFPWCATEHGGTVHPDDEDHRSAGIGLTTRVRDGGAGGPGVFADVEVGLLRRTGDSETWAVLETGVGTSVSIPLHAARALVARLGDDRRTAALLAAGNDVD